MRHERVDRTKLGVRELGGIEQVRQAPMPIVERQKRDRALGKQGRHHDAHDVRDFLIDEFHFEPRGTVQPSLLDTCRHSSATLNRAQLSQWIGGKQDRALHAPDLCQQAFPALLARACGT